MDSHLRRLRAKILELEQSKGRKDVSYRRMFNAELAAHRLLRGGGDHKRGREKEDSIQAPFPTIGQGLLQDQLVEQERRLRTAFRDSSDPAERPNKLRRMMRDKTWMEKELTRSRAEEDGGGLEGKGEGEGQCVICQGPLVFSEKLGEVVSLPCSMHHQLHKECLKQLIRDPLRGCRCPICNKVVPDAWALANVGEGCPTAAATSRAASEARSEGVDHGFEMDVELLFDAAYDGNERLVRRFIDAGYDLNQMDEDGDTPCTSLPLWKATRKW